MSYTISITAWSWFASFLYRLITWGERFDPLLSLTPKCHLCCYALFSLSQLGCVLHPCCVLYTCSFGVVVSSIPALSIRLCSSYSSFWITRTRSSCTSLIPTYNFCINPIMSYLSDHNWELNLRNTVVLYIRGNVSSCQILMISRRNFQTMKSWLLPNITKQAQTCTFSVGWPFLAAEATQELVLSLIFLRLIGCKVLLAGLPMQNPPTPAADPECSCNKFSCSPQICAPSRHPFTVATDLKPWLYLQK